MSLVRRIVAFLFTAAIAGMFVLVIVRPDPAELTPMLFILTGIAWLQTLLLGWAGFGGERIGALDERTFVGFVIAMLGTVSCLIVYNTDHGRSLFPSEVASLLFRLSILAVLSIPAIWVALALWRKLGTAKR